ncbi:hypothetical protein PFISCL1PPCAC_11640, partial [Pristionchus fissidentatus]
LRYKTSHFTNVDSIICEKDPVNIFKYEYVIRANGKVMPRTQQDIYARCAAPICAQCNYLPSVGLRENLTIVDVGSCKQLQCMEGRLMVGRKSGIPACEYHNGKHVWMLDGESIEQSTNVECRKTMPCESAILTSKCDLGPADSRCIVTAEKVPHCSNDQ